ncbi:hypothetical protein ABIB29_003858 [Arthrobacter sp. UYEF36]
MNNIYTPPSDANNWTLPDADYVGPIWPTPPEDLRETDAEALDRRCSEMDHRNSWYR